MDLQTNQITWILLIKKSNFWFLEKKILILILCIFWYLRFLSQQTTLHNCGKSLSCLTRISERNSHRKQLCLLQFKLYCFNLSRLQKTLCLGKQYHVLSKSISDIIKCLMMLMFCLQVCGCIALVPEVWNRTMRDDYNVKLEVYLTC